MENKQTTTDTDTNSKSPETQTGSITNTTSTPVTDTNDTKTVVTAVEEVNKATEEKQTPVTPTVEEIKKAVEEVVEKKTVEPVLPEVKEAPILLTATATAPATKNKKPILAFIAGVLVAVLGWYVYSNVINKKDMAVGTFPDVVATVNGEEISGAELAQSYNQTASMAVSQGAATDTAEVQAALQEQALTVITNTRLLVQTATNAGFEASPEEIDEQLENIKTQFGGQEALLAEAAKFDLSEEDLKRDISEQIIVDKYLRETLDLDNILVTDEEAKDTYDTFAGNGDDAPAFEDIKDAIKSQLLAQKQQALIAAHIDELRAGADIEILI